ncbi:Fe(3+) ABC transporter substrate-binding protein [Pseudovibrio sp. Tun.PSC04-5.I4]|uniref:Fe(3+) ABC transporter substrate-binding protein n=1 Tax=Pseudovibrio sp. Tun.PSC04-5.I4 TaxID=1798213 RepID=UPI0008882A51|nr:Fe(3+) ABC transporter substrate-binding protein [Pseudovibrio sp. Tun.PSC04-5.I4]SDQ71095.1 iron(III) transport system substrate-binding protein [Pseudovibrio sp. Tun.PSC04-5.I4]
MKSLVKGIGLTVAGAALSATSLLGLGSAAQAEEEVNIYSYRQPELIQPLLKAFTEKTGIKTNIVFAKKGLAERIKAEGNNSPADVLLSVDVGRLQGAKELGVSQPLNSDVINANIPANLRDKDNEWFGLTTRARVIYASKDRVDQDAITYEELADPKWKGRLCTRSGQHVYSIGLIASMVANLGEEGTQKWLEGVRDNLARKPTGNDRAQVKSIFAGECDIALGNTYYMGKMQTNEKDPEQQDWAASVRILFPNTEDRGTHVNISGMILAKNAPHQENAIKLMEYLSSASAQEIYAGVNFEYPVLPGVKASELVASWGSFNPDKVALNEIAAQRAKASELVDLVGFDNGPSS